jgi:hypothetical protein
VKANLPVIKPAGGWEAVWNETDDGDETDDDDTSNDSMWDMMRRKLRTESSVEEKFSARQAQGMSAGGINTFMNENQSDHDRLHQMVNAVMLHEKELDAWETKKRQELAEREVEIEKFRNIDLSPTSWVDRLKSKRDSVFCEARHLLRPTSEEYAQEGLIGGESSEKGGFLGGFFKNPFVRPTAGRPVEAPGSRAFFEIE